VALTPVVDPSGQGADTYRWPDKPSQTAFPVARPGYPFIAAAAFVTFVFALLELAWLALPAMAAAFAICMFFRDPDRVVTTEEKAVVCPADGRVIVCETVEQTGHYEGRCRKISIFMSVLNVHVNRIPFSGTVRRVSYRPGGFVRADKDRASGSNEQNAVFLETADGQRISFVQVAGTVARRIICGLQANDKVVKGQRFGMICFGSRVDLYLPESAAIAVAVGDRVTAGTTIMGYLQ